MQSSGDEQTISNKTNNSKDIDNTTCDKLISPRQIRVLGVFSSTYFIYNF